MLRKIPLALAAAGFLTSSALAQQTLVEVDDAVMVPSLGMDADALDDMDVHNSEGVEIGEVEEILGSDAQTPTHLEIDFEDADDSNYPERESVLVPLDNVSMNGDQLVVNLSPEEVGGLPVRDD